MSGTIQAPSESRRDLPALFVSEFAEVRRVAQPAWLRNIRDKAFEHACKMGLPRARDEAWRFTDVTPIAATHFSVAPPAAVDAAWVKPLSMAAASSAELVFVDGRYAPQLSSVTGLSPAIEISRLADVLDTHRSIIAPQLDRTATDATFGALNTAFFEDGVFVGVPAGAIVDAPISVLFISTLPSRPAMVSPRTLVFAEPGSRATLIEQYASVHPGVGLTNAVTQFVVDEGAVVHHYRLQDESVTAFHVGSVSARLGRDSIFSSHSFVFGAALTRNDVAAGFDGEGGECVLNGLYLVDGTRLADTHTFIDHAKPHCRSHEAYRGILDGTSRGVFGGKIIVRPHALKTDAKQTNRALLLSDAAQVDTMPQLEIFADDVKCTHGAAVGQLDDAALFYLQSRGLARQEARGMLIRSFAGEIVDRVTVPALRVRLDEIVNAWLSQTGKTFVHDPVSQ